MQRPVDSRRSWRERPRRMSRRLSRQRAPSGKGRSGVSGLMPWRPRRRRWRFRGWTCRRYDRAECSVRALRSRAWCRGKTANNRLPREVGRSMIWLELSVAAVMVSIARRRDRIYAHRHVALEPSRSVLSRPLIGWPHSRRGHRRRLATVTDSHPASHLSGPE